MYLLLPLVVGSYYVTFILFRWAIESQGRELVEVEQYASELVNEAETKVLKLESALKVKEDAISDLQIGGTGDKTFCFVCSRIHCVGCCCLHSLTDCTLLLF